MDSRIDSDAFRLRGGIDMVISGFSFCLSGCYPVSHEKHWFFSDCGKIFNIYGMFSITSFVYSLRLSLQ